MAPKRWTKPAASTGSTATGRQSGSAVMNGQLLQFIADQILSNNCLGLAEDEVGGMAKELMGLKTRPEVFEWANTLMMGEPFAAEIIKQREDQGPPFEGETIRRAAVAVGPLDGGASRATQGATLSTQKKKKAKPKRTDINKLPQKAAQDAALKPGQFECGCFGTVHNVRTNCANCGRIICEQESPDICYFCEMEPTRCIAYEISVQEGKVSDAAVQKDKASYESAIAKRDQLLEYAENRAKRTSVIDDQAATLFSLQNAWMSSKERKLAEKDAATEESRRRVEMMHRDRGAYQVHIDFVNKNIALGSVESNTGVPIEGHGAAASPEKGGGQSNEDDLSEEDGSGGDSDDDELAEDLYGAAPLPSLLKQIWYSPDGAAVDDKTKQKATGAATGVASLAMGGTSRPVQEVSRRVQQDYFSDDVELFVEEALTMRPDGTEFAFDPDHPHNLPIHEDDDDNETSGDGVGASPAKNQSSVAPSNRFAVTPLMRARDEGVCLSMHQPWASLLVAGIKMHEGRVWNTDYRGRLWIHAAAHEATDIQEVEDHYRQFVPPQQPFPEHYPTRVLLGYVYVTDVLDRDAYEEAFTPEARQEGSPYSFICVEPKMLPFPLPMTGDHKLFKLDHKIVTAAKRQLGELEG